LDRDPGVARLAGAGAADADGMTDEQIQAQRDRSYFTLDDACTQIVALADEALRRGQLIEAGLRSEHRNRERIARLEAALRFYGDPATWLVVYDHHDTEEEPYKNSFVPANDDGGQQARAALSEKP